MGTFNKFVMLDDKIQEIADEPWSAFWCEHKSGTKEFGDFILNPLPTLETKLNLSPGYRISSFFLNHNIAFTERFVCCVGMVFHEEKLVHLTFYKHKPE